MKGCTVRSHRHDPCYNLALEEYLLEYVRQKGHAVLYLWQNENTVVIGKNQNAYTECNMDYAASANIKIVRRLTGGGAVYHDLGNLNFTIITPKTVYDVTRSTNMVVKALRNLGIAASVNGRNDICVGEEKISGNAYFSDSLAGMHHGTVLLDVDMERLGRVLNVSMEKLQKRGIKSVQSRVVNLASLYPKITVKELADEIENSFYHEYQFERMKNPARINQNELAVLVKKYESKDWNLDFISDYQLQANRQLSFGQVTASFKMDGERIRKFEISTDSLNTASISRFRAAINEMIRLQSFDMADREKEHYKKYFGKETDIAEEFLDLFFELCNKLESV